MTFIIKTFFSKLILIDLILFFNTVNLSFSTPDRDRPVSVTKLWSQISHPNRTFFTVPLILNKSTGFKLTINVSLISTKNI
jgi:hypothetical protein